MSFQSVRNKSVAKTKFGKSRKKQFLKVLYANQAIQEEAVKRKKRDREFVSSVSVLMKNKKR